MLSCNRSFQTSAFILASFLIPIVFSPGVAQSQYGLGTTITHPVGVKAGWNLLSIPVDGTGGLIDSLFPTAISPAFEYRGGYVSSESLTTRQGFWLKFVSAETLFIPGVLEFDRTIEVQPGWNIIGTCSVPIVANQITATPPGIVRSDYYRYIPDSGYVVSDTLFPGFGYWVKVDHNGTLDLKDSRTTTGRTTIDTNEIGGKDLKLFTCYGESSPSTDDTLSVRVSRQGNQLLLALDENKKIRGLSLSTPRNGDPDLRPVDAHSTAITLIFITPGILTTDTSEYDATIYRISTLQNFSSFQEFLAGYLPTDPLTVIVANDQYDSLLANCIREYREQYYPLYHSLPIPVDGKNKFAMVQTNGSPWTTLSMANFSWRFVNVVRRDLTSYRSHLQNTPVKTNMGGAIPLSWGCLLTFSCFSPTIENAQFIFPENAGYSDLWVIGPGWGLLSDSPPSDIRNYQKPWTASMLYYVVFPFVDLFTGAIDFFNAGPEWLLQAAQKIEVEVMPSAAYVAWVNSNSVVEAVATGLDFAIALVGAASTVGVLTGIAAKVAIILSAGSMVWSGSNLLLWTIEMSSTDPYTKFPLRVTGAPCPGIESVDYEGGPYPTVLIGDQCWISNNLNVGSVVGWTQDQSNNSTTEKYCYDDESVNCNIPGGLYQWNEAMQYSNTPGTQGICPPGWHIPTLDEYQTLSATVLGDANALKATGEGADDGIGTNESGFTALLSGFRQSNLILAPAYGAFWTSTESDITSSYFLGLEYNDNLIRLTDLNNKTAGLSVRCLKD